MTVPNTPNLARPGQVMTPFSGIVELIGVFIPLLSKLLGSSLVNNSPKSFTVTRLDKGSLLKDGVFQTIVVTPRAETGLVSLRVVNELTKPTALETKGVETPAISFVYPKKKKSNAPSGKRYVVA